MDEAEIRTFIKDRGVHTVRVAFGDLHGVLRGRTVPAAAFVDGILADGMEMSNAVFAMDSRGGIAPGTSIPMDIGFPNWRMVPDPNTFAPVPWRDGTARILCDVVAQGREVEVAPRTVLKRQLEALEAEGVTGRMAPEYEFYVFTPRTAGKAPVPVNPVVQYNSELKHAEVAHMFTPLLLALEAQGTPVEAFGQEYSPSQYELNLRHRPLLAAADGAVVVKETVKEALSDQGFLATFMAKPLPDANGSGCHIHLSLYDREGRNLFFDRDAEDGLSPFLRHFVAGLLAHAEALFALTNPTVNCYKRAVPGRFAPVNVTWGYDNRSCLVRVPQARGTGTHIEFRGPSAMANPYVALAALLAAGHDGVARGLNPPSPTLGDAGAVDARRLPTSLPEALAALAADEALIARLGPAFCQDFLAVKRHEAERFARAVTDWEWDEYLDMY